MNNRFPLLLGHGLIQNRSGCVSQGPDSGVGSLSGHWTLLSLKGSIPTRPPSFQTPAARGGPQATVLLSNLATNSGVPVTFVGVS